MNSAAIESCTASIDDFITTGCQYPVMWSSGIVEQILEVYPVVCLNPAVPLPDEITKTPDGVALLLKLGVHHLGRVHHEVLSNPKRVACVAEILLDLGIAPTAELLQKYGVAPHVANHPEVKDACVPI
jgi:hypothetical protein